MVFWQRWGLQLIADIQQLLQKRTTKDIVSEAVVDAISKDIPNPYGKGTALIAEEAEVSATEDCTAEQLEKIWVDNLTAEKVSITTCFAENSNPLKVNLDAD